MKQGGPIRALHFLHRLHTGGVGTWMIQLLRRLDRDALQIDLVVQDDAEGLHEREALELGANIVHITEPRQLRRYSDRVREVLRKHGPYDIVHAHMGHWSGLLLRLAAREHVPVRIAHSRLDVREVEQLASPLWRPYYWLMRRWLDRYASAWWAVSNEAGVGQFGDQWYHDPRSHIFRSGIDLDPFTERPDRAAVRHELGLPANDPVIGHIGRFTNQKNHAFLVDIFAGVVEREPGARLLLVGEGELMSTVRERVESLGLGDRVHFAGSRPDVAQLLMGAMDVLVLPSLHEGLPRVALEAQAAGLPLVIANTISAELSVVDELIHWRALSESAEAWAQTIFDAIAKGSCLSPAEALNELRQSLFNIDDSPERLIKAYRQLTGRTTVT
jgi:glycosyltransferase involved in cell wall biosynthesis